MPAWTAWDHGALRQLADDATRSLAAEGACVEPVGTPGGIGSLCASSLGVEGSRVDAVLELLLDGRVQCLGVGVPEAVVPDLVEALGQDVLEEAPEELDAVELHDLPLGATAVSVLEGDGVVVDVEDTPVVDGDAEDVPGEVGEHDVDAMLGLVDVNDPGLVPDQIL